MGHTALWALKGNSYRSLGSIPTCKETSMDLPPALFHCPPHPITDESPLARTVTVPQSFGPGLPHWSLGPRQEDKAGPKETQVQ